MLYHSDEMRFKILIIDDEIGMCVSLSKILSAQGYENIYTSDPTEVDRLLSAEDIDLIIMDVKMPGIDGISLLKSIKTRGSRIPIIMISGYASVENIVRAMKFGALNFYKKPIHIKELIAEIQRISEARCSENDGKTVHKIITQDPKIQKLLSIVEKVAVTDVPVVITGESGTGKELFAEVIHEMSPRREGPLIKINCAAIPETLIESELFGYEKGAFTDAKNTRIGRFEEANGGSVFLDEIGEMNIKTQAKLLRVLQEKEFQRLGSNSVHKTDVRFIAASNRDFEELIANNLFREDLYYRLSVIRLEIPSLRERKGDILLLSNYFLDTFNRIYGKSIRGFTDGVIDLFMQHTWPGNVRELRNCIERAVIFTDEEMVSEESLPFQYEPMSSPNPEMYQKIIDNVTREMILDALDKCGGVRKEAAELLNIHRKTLYNKMKKFGIT